MRRRDDPVGSDQAAAAKLDAHWFRRVPAHKRDLPRIVLDRCRVTSNYPGIEAETLSYQVPLVGLDERVLAENVLDGGLDVALDSPERVRLGEGCRRASRKNSKRQC
jgi:hypothetical protein